jgi:hypothetical protein
LVYVAHITRSIALCLLLLLLLLLQDVCVVLELRDATLLVPNMRKMAAVLAAIPKLEAFVAQVRMNEWMNELLIKWMNE